MEVFLIVIAIILVGITGWLYYRVRTIERQFGTFFQGTQPQPVMRALNQYAQAVKEQSGAIKKLEHDLKLTNDLARNAGTRIGFVRFNPFNDTGGDQSFCLALIDDHGSGYILSSIHARTGTRVYAKQIQAGHSSHNLSDEESAALTKALKSDSRQTHAR